MPPLHPVDDRAPGQSVSEAERRHREMLLAIKEEYLTDLTIRRVLAPARRSLTYLAEIRKLFG